MKRATVRSVTLVAGAAVFLATASCGTEDDLDLSSAQQESHSWNGYHWARQSSSFTLKIGDNVSSAWDSVLGTTISDWSKSTVLDLTRVDGSVTRLRRCRPTAGRVEVCNTTYGFNGWLGVASVWVSGGHITQGTVKLNDSYFNTATYNTTAWRNLVSCQEVGHTIGLDHQDENFNNANLGTCMDYTNDPSSNQHPNQHDYEELQIIYQHTDSSTTVGMTVDADFSTRESWGELVSSTHGGRQETYVRDLGQGTAVWTFVIWAD